MRGDKVDGGEGDGVKGRECNSLKLGVREM
jgi:hypothetical protein